MDLPDPTTGASEREDYSLIVGIRIHLALFLGFASLIGLFVLIALVSAGTGLRTELTARYQNELERELGLAEALIESRGEADLRSVVLAIAEQTGYRVTLIALDGRVIEDSEVLPQQLPSVEDHGDRTEFVGALEGDVSFSERVSATVRRPFLYGATLSTLDGEPIVLRMAASLGEVNRAVRDARRVVQGAGLMALLVALLLSYGLSHLLARPLVSVVSSTRELGAGDLSVRVRNGQRIQEVGELASAFNTLADSLQARVAELQLERDEIQALIDCIEEGVIALDSAGRIQRMNETARTLLGIEGTWKGMQARDLELDPPFRGLLEEGLAQSGKVRSISAGERDFIVSTSRPDGETVVVTILEVTELRRLEQVRRDFVANASHELKTPLTAMRGIAETLVDGDPPAEVRRRFLESIHKNTIRLQRLVDDLLDLSRLEGGRWKAERDVLDLDIAVLEAWGPFSAQAENRGIEFEVQGTATVVADEQGLFQIFRNLFENSLRHTPEGGTITVDIRSRGGMAEISVTDSGSGIPESALPRIFERFYRVDPARSREGGGTGLGLAIVRHLVLAMEGDVVAESEEGKGTTIRFTVPLLERAQKTVSKSSQE